MSTLLLAQPPGDVHGLVDERPYFTFCEVDQSTAATRAACSEEFLLQTIEDNMTPIVLLRARGSSELNFIVEVDGSVSEIKLLKSFDREIDEEIFRIVKFTKGWTPGKIAGKPVRTLVRVPIAFTPDDSPVNIEFERFESIFCQSYKSAFTTAANINKLAKKKRGETCNCGSSRVMLKVRMYYLSSRATTPKVLRSSKKNMITEDMIELLERVKPGDKLSFELIFEISGETEVEVKHYIELI
jgi:hypothetical protein